MYLNGEIKDRDSDEYSDYGDFLQESHVKKKKRDRFDKFKQEGIELAEIDYSRYSNSDLYSPEESESDHVNEVHDENINYYQLRKNKFTFENIQE